MLAVAGGHQLDDVGVDLFGRNVDAELVVDVPRPLRRAHAHHRPLCLVVVAAAVLADVALADLVPDRLAVDDDAVEVEDDGFDAHDSARYPPPTWTSGGASSPSSAASTSPTNSVWSPTSHSDREAAFEPADRAGQERRALRSLVVGDAVPHRDRRHAAREVLREPLLAAGEQADREAAGLAQQLMELRLLRDRDADERWLEGQRDERAHRLAEQRAVDVDRDNGDAAREAAHDFAKIVPVGHGPIIGRRNRGQDESSPGPAPLPVLGGATGVGRVGRPRAGRACERPHGDRTEGRSAGAASLPSTRPVSLRAR